MRQCNAPMSNTQNSQKRFNLPQTQISEQCMEESTKSFGNILKKTTPLKSKRSELLIDNKKKLKRLVEN